MDCGFEEPEVKSKQTAKISDATCKVPSQESASDLSLKLGPQHLPWDHPMQMLGKPVCSKAVLLRVVDSDEDQGQTSLMRPMDRPNVCSHPTTSANREWVPAKRLAC